ncbi:hypothetical protein GOODEAATRI_027813, partial [Goodea atripinnis]
RTWKWEEPLSRDELMARPIRDGVEKSGGGAMEVAGTRGNRQQDMCKRKKKTFLCNRKRWRD